MPSYIEILVQIRKLLIDYAKKNNIQFNSVDKNYKRRLTLNENYDIYELDKNTIDDEGAVDYHGVTYVDVKDWISYKEGVRIADLNTLSIDKLGVCLRFRSGDNIPIEIVIHTFLHELAHTVTIPEQRITKTINKRTKAIQLQNTITKKNAFMPCHHSDNFYRNFATILRMAEQLNIYILPATHRNFMIKNLQRYDCMFSPDDKLSVGISPLYKDIKIT